MTASGMSRIPSTIVSTRFKSAGDNSVWIPSCKWNALRLAYSTRGTRNTVQRYVYSNPISYSVSNFSLQEDSDSESNFLDEEDADYGEDEDVYEPDPEKAAEENRTQPHQLTDILVYPLPPQPESLPEPEGEDEGDHDSNAEVSELLGQFPEDESDNIPPLHLRMILRR